jgi:hypothetical protein
MSPSFTFTATVWLWKGDSAWHFISLPEDVADEIEAITHGHARGCGSVPVEVRSADVTWQTSIFPDKKSGTYLLPLKKQVRQHLGGCEEGSRVKVTVRIREM